MFKIVAVPKFDPEHLTRASAEGEVAKMEECENFPHHLFGLEISED